MYYYWTIGDVSIVDVTAPAPPSYSYLSWMVLAPYHMLYEYISSLYNTATMYTNYFSGEPLVFVENDVHALRATIDAIDLSDPVSVLSVVDFVAHNKNYDMNISAGLEQMMDDALRYIPGRSKIITERSFSQSSLIRDNLKYLHYAAHHSNTSSSPASANPATLLPGMAEAMQKSGPAERETVLAWLSAAEMQPLHSDLASLLAEDKAADAGAGAGADSSAGALNTTATGAPSELTLWDLLHVQHARAQAHALALASQTSSPAAPAALLPPHLATQDQVAAKAAADMILESIYQMTLEKPNESLILSPSGFTMQAVEILHSAKIDGLKLPRNISYTSYTYLDMAFVAVSLLRCFVSPIQILIRIYLLGKLNKIEHLPNEELRIVLMQLNAQWPFQVHHLIGLVLMNMTYAMVVLVLLAMFFKVGMSSLFYSAIMALTVHFVVMAKAMVVMQQGIEGEFDPEIADHATNRVLSAVAAAGKMSQDEVKTNTVVADAHVVKRCVGVVSNDTCAICMCDFEYGALWGAFDAHDSNSNAVTPDVDNPDEAADNADNSGKCDIVRVLGCGHYFHLACVDHWLVHKKSICPTCRESAFYKPGRVDTLRKEVLRAGTDRRAQWTARQAGVSPREVNINGVGTGAEASVGETREREVRGACAPGADSGDDSEEDNEQQSVLRNRFSASATGVYPSSAPVSINSSVPMNVNPGTDIFMATDKVNEVEDEDDIESLDAIFDSVFNPKSQKTQADDSTSTNH